MHPLLGPRQAEIVELLAATHPDWMPISYLDERMDQSQTNIHLTLKGMIQQGLVEKDSTVRPQLYRLDPALYDGE